MTVFPAGSAVGGTQLRAELARRLSRLYATEVPAYQQLVDVSAQVNADVLRKHGAAAEELGSLDRVTAERHGAVRVGTPAELAQLGRVLAAFGMHPVGFYDLRDASPTPVPVVSTAFRPVEPHELAQNPFRLFVSVLVPEDRRFFDDDLAQQVHGFLARRSLFPPRLLELADRAAADGALDMAHTEELLRLTVASLELTDEPIDRAWYDRLAQVSSVAADIAGVASTHLNHLTPRVLDIDELHARMTALGVRMLDRIEGPPRWDGPDVLLRQTSFRALDERRRMREADGTVQDGTLRVRFGEVEARGVALTAAGRERYERGVADAAAAAAAGEDAAAALRRTWAEQFPRTLVELATQGLAHCTFSAATGHGTPPGTGLTALLEQGWLTPHPVVYEDFLPKSAAGIFQSNLDGDGSAELAREAAARDAQWLAGVLDRPLHDDQLLCARQTQVSLEVAAVRLGLPHLHDDRPTRVATARTPDQRTSR
jgi:uncharacterized glyoxalase superfamily metalloenzyme YdcJ